MNEGSKFKLESLEVKDSYIFLVDIVNFKLRLINFVYFFETTTIFARFFRLAMYFNSKSKNLHSLLGLGLSVAPGPEPTGSLAVWRVKRLTI